MRSARRIDVTDHKFRIGEQAERIPSPSERFAAPGNYEVVQQLPVSNGEVGYRIKSAQELYQRAVRESQLHPLSSLA